MFPKCYGLVKTRSNNIKTLPKCDDLMKIKTETQSRDFRASVCGLCTIARNISMGGSGNRDIIVSFSHFVVSIVITFRRFHPQPFWLQVVWENSTLQIQPVLSFGMFEYERREIPFGGTLVQQERNYLWDRYGVMCAVRRRHNWQRRMLSTALPESREV